MIGKRLVSTGSSISERINPSSGAKWVTANGDGTIGYTTSESLSGSWSKTSQIFSTRGECVLWNGTAWVVGGRGGYTLAYSSNGTSWTGIDLSGQFGQTIGWNGTYWLLGTNNSAWYTTDATGSSGWTQVSNGINGNTANGGSQIIWDGTNWIVGGDNLWRISGSNPNGTATNILNVGWAVVDWGGPNGKFVISSRNDSNTSLQAVYTMDDSTSSLVNRVSSWQLGIVAAATPNGAYAIDCCNYFRWAYSSDYVNWSVVSQGSGGLQVGQGQFNGTVYGAIAGKSTDSIYIQNNDSIGVNLTSATVTNTGMNTGTNIRYIGSDNDRNRFYPYVDPFGS